MQQSSDSRFLPTAISHGRLTVPRMGFIFCRRLRTFRVGQPSRASRIQAGLLRSMTRLKATVPIDTIGRFRNNWRAKKEIYCERVVANEAKDRKPDGEIKGRARPASE